MENEKVKDSERFFKISSNSACVFLCCHCTDTKSNFLMWRLTEKPPTRTFFFLLLKLSVFPKNSTPEKCVTTAKDPFSFLKIHFNNDVFADMAVVNYAKTPYYCLSGLCGCYKGRGKRTKERKRRKQRHWMIEYHKTTKVWPGSNAFGQTSNT